MELGHEMYVGGPPSTPTSEKGDVGPSLILPHRGHMGRARATKSGSAQLERRMMAWVGKQNLK